MSTQTSLLEILGEIEQRAGIAKRYGNESTSALIESCDDVPRLVKALRYYREQLARSTDEMNLFRNDEEAAQLLTAGEPEKTEDLPTGNKKQPA